MTPPDAINLAAKLATFTDTWSPRIAARVNDHDVRLVHLDQREFPWHHHENTDEMFLCIAGEFSLEFRDRSVPLKPGEMIVVPRGVEHRPTTATFAQALIFERSDTVNTGSTQSDMTVEAPPAV